jgi:3-dehydroquinate dehydratase II
VTGSSGAPRHHLGVIHGPNLHLLGTREPGLYGTGSLEDVNRALNRLASDLGVHLEVIQSNHEGVLVDWITEASPRVAGFLVNAAGLTHTSVVLRDALLAVGRPFVEVHLSNTAAREAFRHRSLLADRAVGVVYGFGVQSYLLGLRGLAAHLDS